MLSPTDCELLERLWREQAPVMRSYLRPWTRDARETDETVAEVYWRAGRALARGRRPQTNPTGWLWRILHHYRIDQARARARRPRLVTLTEEMWTEMLPSPEQIEACVQVREAVAKLTPSQAAVIRLRHFAGYELQDIAARFGISYGAVKALHYRATVQLREELRKTDLV